MGLQTNHDFRWVRLWWENLCREHRNTWRPFAKGGAFSPFYADVFLAVRWDDDGYYLKAWKLDQLRQGFIAPNNSRCWNESQYFRPGLTWPLRTNGLSFRVMPTSCIFGHKGPAAFVHSDNSSELLALCALMNSAPFGYLVSVQLARTELAQSYEVGLIQQTPLPNIAPNDHEALVKYARRAWSLKCKLDSISEISHAFLLPAILRARREPFDPTAMKSELAEIQTAIDDLTFRAYELSGADRAAIEAWVEGTKTSRLSQEVESEEVDETGGADGSASLHSWAVGVTFGRFDLRLATGERKPPPEPEPFDPLPTRSPGMIPEADDAQFPARPILVDDSGHSLDLAAQVEAVLERVGLPAESPEALRRWLGRDFFSLHIKMYSKSRRKAPIYWQLATPSATYSVWLYIHAFTRDTLYKAQEIAETKLRHEEVKLDRLRTDLGPHPKAGERKTLAAQEVFVEELKIFLDEVKRVAPLWNPDLDDGVIINFAPLWRLVPHHKPWQKELKATWDALCAGEYDWAHLAMHLWPERVVPQCATDRSLAIAHGLEEVFWIEAEDGKWRPRSIPARPVEELVRERTSQAVKAALKSLLEAPVVAGGRTRGRRAGESS